MKSNAGIVGEVIGVFIVLILMPVLSFCGGWIDGWLLKQFVGESVANGLNVLFDTTRFTPNIIPIVCGTLAMIGSYFYNHVNSNKKD